jgi:hypothetical protein
MQQITATDAAANLTALILFGLIPALQAGDLSQVWDILQLPLTGFLLLVIGMFLKNQIYTRSTVEEWRSDFEKERAKELAARDTRFDLMMTEHVKAMAMMEKERDRERVQSEARHSATVAYYETLLAQHASLLAENTALLKRMADQNQDRSQKVA